MRWSAIEPFIASLATIGIVPNFFATIRAISCLVFGESVNVFLAWTFVKWQ